MTLNFDEAIVPFGGSAPHVENPNKDILGGKGMGLQEMSSIGIDVPPGFTLITKLCQVFDEKGDLPAELWALVDKAVERVEQDMGRKFGDTSGAQPLLFSCRSGAKISMPGMMDTVLNVGLNKESVEGMAKATGNRRFAFDAYRRLLVSLSQHELAPDIVFAFFRRNGSCGLFPSTTGYVWRCCSWHSTRSF